MWKLTSDKKLQNQNGDWLYSFKRWELPGEDNQGSIKDLDSGKVLSTLTTIKVSLEDEKDLLSINQCYWTKSKEDSDGWFRLCSVENPGKFLCVKGNSRLIIAGKIGHLFYCLSSRKWCIPRPSCILV